MDQQPEMEAGQLSEDAVKAATAHAEAVEVARQKQVEVAFVTNREETKNIFAQAMREVLSTGDEGTKTLLLQKIPLLCTDILTMKADSTAIKKDVAEIKQIGMYLLLGVGTLFLTLVGALLLRGIN